MSELNTLQVQGTVTQPGMLKTNEDGTKYCSFSIVSNIPKKQNDGSYVNEPNYFPIALFGSYAEKMVKHITKGRRLIVEGFLRQSHWEKDGQKMSGISIGVNKLHLIFEKKDKAENNNIQAQNYSSGLPENDLNDFFDDQELY